MEITQLYLTPHYLDDPEDVLAHLAAPIRAIRDALDHGISFADTQMSATEWDASLWAHNVRHAARIELARQKAESWALTKRKLANSGIHVICEPLIIKVLKAQDDGPPYPGHSEARKRYYSQQTLAPELPLIWGEIVAPPGPNFIVDWSTNQQREVLLALSKPQEIWGYKEPQKLAWRRPIILPPDDGLRFTPGEEREITLESVIDLEELEALGDSQ